MSKKKFIEGLENLLMEEGEVSFSKESPYLSKTDKKKEESVATPQTPNRSSGSGKNFSSDLSDIFREAVTDSLEDQLEKRSSAGPSAYPRKRRSSRPMDGLDSLIRQTIESGELEVTYGKRKRVTLTFEKEKLEKLKEIAKLERSYLRDIVNRIVTDFIQEYEEQK